VGISVGAACFLLIIIPLSFLGWQKEETCGDGFFRKETPDTELDSDFFKFIDNNVCGMCERENCESC